MSRSGRPATAFLVGGLVVAAALALYTQAVRDGGWSPDEEYFVQLARVLSDHFPGGVWDVGSVPAFNERGVQRLLVLLLAWPLGGVDGETGMRIAHALLGLVW